MRSLTDFFLELSCRNDTPKRCLQFLCLFLWRPGMQKRHRGLHAWNELLLLSSVILSNQVAIAQPILVPLEPHQRLRH